MRGPLRRLTLPAVLLVMAVVIPLVLHHSVVLQADQALSPSRVQAPVPVVVDHTMVFRPGTHPWHRQFTVAT